LQLSQSLELILVAYAAVLVARIATVYPILTIFDRLSKTTDKKIPLKWRNIAMLGGMKGALSIALATSISASALISSGDVDMISNLVLGVAFLSIVLQSAIISRYVVRIFPQEGSIVEEELNVRLARAVTAIGDLEKERIDGKISESDFVDRLESDKDELGEVLSEMDARSRPTRILKTRTNDLYTSISDTLWKSHRSPNQKSMIEGDDQVSNQSADHKDDERNDHD
jgi:hypothetical protein